MKYTTLSLLAGALFLSMGFTRPVHAAEHAQKQVKATWYGGRFHGRTMANGKPFNKNDPTIVAHKTLPLGTLLLVENALNGKKCVVTVQDRGPFNKKDGAVALDFSMAAASHLGFIKDGKAVIAMTVLKRG